ncbi:alpha/beta fold hydrolase [Pandoraea terrigena]|uniref:2-succinyl-6-hydroxy-2, 4-cyclohexadiene-1-carboxylate synthase n=1 Tax=Pandoraea terrigena TaxID=2508292 RepID=A0A5E4SMS4_9BURK|nr:alpha/beta hydrolase [Pandoraea terrigena]VVD77156.1 2-succinyl-6-hydroxy-2, 4-cyclohexadiene-1-carboxylate synthase [Pandoraea terrigena]
MDIRRIGKPDGFPVVALHGIQGTSDAWIPVATALGDAFRFVLPNMPGRGDAESPSDPGAYGIDNFARIASVSIEQEVGACPYALAGWSMGVSVILELMTQLANGTARCHPPAAIVLLSGTAQLNEVAWFRASDATALLDEIRLRQIRLGMKHAADPLTVSWTWNAMKRVSHLPNLAHVAVPTLIIHGSDDEDCPIDHAHRMRDGLRHAALQVIPGARHSILTQNTREVCVAMRRFLTQHSTASRCPSTPEKTS